MVRFLNFDQIKTSEKKNTGGKGLPPTMSFVSQLNGTFPTSFPTSDEWSGYLAHAQAHLQNNSRLVILLLINTPVIIIILNILRQFVRDPKFCIVFGS